jgi:hypothetical protein
LKGVLPERAEALLAAWEAATADDGLERDGRWWDEAWESITAQRRAPSVCLMQQPHRGFALGSGAGMAATS